MALKSIIDIDVNDGKFKEFKELYDEYRVTLEKMPQQWQDVSKGTKAAATHFEEIAETAEAYSRAVENVRKANEKSQTVVAATGKIWHTMARDTRTVASNITDITRQLLRWAEITGVVSGLLGAGGLFGITRLAQSAASGRAQASGLDVSYGQNRAFAINYGRFLDNPSGTLGNVSNALHDVTSPGYRALLGAGLTPEFLQNHNAAEVTAELMHRLPGRIPHGTAQDRALEGARLKAYGLDSLVSQQELNRYLNASPQEREAQDKAFARDSKDFDQTGKTQREWQDFETQLERAGTKIDEIFIKGLAPLAKPLSDLSDSVAKAVGSLLGSDKLKGWIEGLGQGIEHLANYLLSPAFDQDLKNFVTGVEDIVKALGEAYRWIHGWFETNPMQVAPKNGPAGPAVISPSTPQDVAPKNGAGGPIYLSPSSPGGVGPKNGVRKMSFDGSGFGGAMLIDAAYHPDDDDGSGAGVQRFGRSFMLLVMAADAVTSKFKDLSDAMGGLLTGASVDISGGILGAGGASQASYPRGGAGRSGGASLGSAGPVAAATQGQLGRIKTAVSYFMQQGLSKDVAIGLVSGTIGGESAYGDPRFQRGDNGTAFGIGQWHMDRVKDILAHTGIDVRTASYEDQLKAMRWEMEHGKGGGHVWQQFLRAKTADEAVGVAVHGFERPANQARDIARRRGMAAGVARQLQGAPLGTEEAARSPEMHRGRGITGYHGVTKQPRIDIHDSTGGNVIISAHMLTIGT